MKRYAVMIDGEGYEMPANERFRFACCDCGLVHDMVVATLSKRKTFGFAVQRNKRATTWRRKWLAALREKR